MPALHSHARVEEGSREVRSMPECQDRDNLTLPEIPASSELLWHDIWRFESTCTSTKMLSAS